MIHLVYPVVLSTVYSSWYGLNGPLIDMSKSLSVISLNLTTSSQAMLIAWVTLLIELISHLGPIKLTHWSGCVSVPFSHFQSVSILQNSSQPSPLTVLLSSHSTKPRFAPLPHVSSHVFVTGTNLRNELIWVQDLQVSSDLRKVEYGQSMQLLELPP